MTTHPAPARAELLVDLSAISANVATLREAVAPAALMAVVKADGYGHGLVESARAARTGGASWLGVAFVDEAMRLREAGDTGRILSWLATPGEDLSAAVGADIDVTAYTVAEVAEIAAAARTAGRAARLQLKVDTGLNRGGAAISDWPAVVAAAVAAERDGVVRVTGIWSHLACSDEPRHPANDEQEQAFRAALATAEEAGLRPEVRHLANSAAALTRPSSRFDLVRCGLACYGLSPVPDLATPAELGIVPAMTARSRLAQVKPVPEGAPVSYGQTWFAPVATTLGLVPVGYGDGIPRAASNRAEVLVGGLRAPVVGRVCMDQFVVDLGAREVEAGAEVVLFGPGLRGEPTAEDWALASDSISYEVVTRMGGRFVRRYPGVGQEEGSP